MSVLLPLLQAVARDELAARRTLELAVVTDVATNAGGAGDHNLAVHARVRGSAVELQHVPVAVGRLGLSSVPRVGDLVVVGFVAGDLNGPVVLGSLYDEQVRPPDAEPDEVVYAVPDDAAAIGVRRLAVELPNGNTVTVDDDTVVVKMGGTSLTIESDGAIALEASGDISLRAGGDVRIEAGGDITAEADANVTVEAGANAEVKASGNASVEGSATAKLKGGLVTIAGTTSFSAG
ncbi:hypothetical protein BH18ACT4_BH18ACT4_09460 [soil metagenome]